MAYDFKTFRRVVPHVLREGHPVLIRGRHGIGKSESIYQIAKGLGDVLGLEHSDVEVVEMRASQMTEGDLIGLPMLNDEVTKFNPPDWFKEACDHPRVLFFDEVDRAVPEVRQGIFQITDSHRCGQNYLHKDTRVVAAVNGGEHGQQYMVGEMDPAELDRWTVFDLEPTSEDWLEWAKTDGNVDPSVIDFIRMNDHHLEHDGQFEPNKVYPSRRSWKRCNDALAHANVFSDENYELLYLLVNSYCGQEAAIQYRDFCEEYDRQVTPDEIVNQGKLDKVDDFTIPEHIGLIEKFKREETFKEQLTEDQMKNVRRYFGELPGECALQMIVVLANPENAYQNLVELGWSDDDNENEAAIKFFVNLLSDENADSIIEKAQELGKSEEDEE